VKGNAFGEFAMNEKPDEQLTDNQKTEKATADIFLDLYNKRCYANFRIVKLRDIPDVECKDESTGERLFLEVTLLEDWEGDIRYIRNEGPRRTTSPDTGLPAISFKDDTIPKLKKRLEKKLRTNYGPNTALVIRQASILWTANSYQRYSREILSEVFRGRAVNYEAGVWVLCRKVTDSGFEYDICLLSELQPEETEHTSTGWIGVTYERDASTKFDEFVSRADVDQPYRIESPHGCEEAILVAFMKGAPEERRQKTIEFYRNQMVYYCRCGKGKFRCGNV
jgi:hypothetical protein